MNIFTKTLIAGVLVSGLTASPGLLADHDARIKAAQVTVREDRVTYDISCLTVPAGVPVTVAVTTSDGASQTTIATDSVASAYQWRASDAPARRHFTITPQGGEAMVVASRLLPLEGGRNFRDLGGYTTEDGRTVKWGKAFRSGVMDSLTDKDYGFLRSMGIVTVCDLRSNQERQSEPTRWRAGDIDYVTFPDPVENEDTPSLLSALSEPNVTPARVAESMAEGYVGIAYQQAPAYRDMFDRLARGEIPLAFNCSAGKDRAGTGAALLLTLLGVPRATVVEDYALSDDFVDYMSEFLGDDARREAADSPYAFLFELPPDVVAPLMRSDPVYIESTFAALEKSHGSVMAFIRQELDVTESEIKAIREALLE